MADGVPIFDPTNYRQVKARILKLLTDGLVIIPESHAQSRMKERRVSDTDVLYVIRTGRIVEHSKPSKSWRYSIEGYDLSGTPRRNIRCVVEINGYLVVITVIVKRR